MVRSSNEDVPTTYPLNDRHLTDLRKELEDKIEKRLPIWIFVIVVSIAVGTFGSTFIMIKNSIDKNNDKIESLNNRITVIETKMNLHNLH